MRQALVYRNNILAGILIEDNGYTFRYNDDYFNDRDKPAISLTMPKTNHEYKSDNLFSFFYNMLSEGVNKRIQSRQFKIDENDHFGLLLASAHTDTIGAVTVRALEEE